MDENGHIRVGVEFKGKMYLIKIGTDNKNLQSFIKILVEKFKIGNEEFTLEYYDDGLDSYVVLENLDYIKNNSKVKIIIEEQQDTKITIENLTSLACFHSPIKIEEILLDNEENIPVQQKKRESTRNTWHLNYKLPQFPPTIERILTNKQLISSSEKDIVISIMYNDIKDMAEYYPKSHQYNSVISLLLEAYPKLWKDIVPSIDIAAAAWKRKLQNKFRNSRPMDGANNIYVLDRKQKRKLDCVKENIGGNMQASAKSLKSFCGIQNYLPSFEPGEDEESGKNYKELLQKLVKKKNVDVRKITTFLERTFALRRHEIVTLNKSCRDVITEYPFLNDKCQMALEFSRILGTKEISITNFKESIRQEFQWVQTLFKSRKKKSSVAINCLQLRYSETCHPHEYKILEEDLTILYLATLLLDKVESFIIFDSEALKENECSPICIVKNFEDDFTVLVDNIKISKLRSITECMYYYMASFYIFNLNYQKSSKNITEFIQKHVMKISDNGKTSSIVTSLMVRLGELKNSRT